MNAVSDNPTPVAPRLVSVVIPVYNGARYVAQAIDSVLAQTWPAIEVIVVNDGSDDGGATLRVVERYGSAVRLIVKPNGGVSSALNAGIAAMRGQWFSWLSHDDLYRPTKIERAMQALEGRTDLAIVFGDVDLIDEHARFLATAGLASGLGEVPDPRWLVLEGKLSGCTLLIPRACLAAVGPFDVGMPTTQDYAFWFELASRYPFVPVREPLVQSRVHGEQGSRHARHLEEASLLFIQLTERMQRDDPAPTPERTLAVLRRMQRHLRQTPYRGAREYVEARVRQSVQKMPVALVCVVGSFAAPGEAIQLLAVAGASCAELLLIDRDGDAASFRHWTETAWPLPHRVVRLPAQAAGSGEVLALALAHSTAEVLVIIENSTLLNAPALQEGLQTVAAHEADVWLGAAPPLPQFGGLPVAVYRRTSVASAMAAGPQAFPMLGLHARLKVHEALPVYAEPQAATRTIRLARREFIGGNALPLQAMPRSDRPTLLILLHGQGGGTIRYAELIAASVGQRANLLFGWGVMEQTFRLSSCAPDVPEIEYQLPGQLARLVADLRLLQVVRVDALHSMGLEQHLDRLLGALGVPFDLTLLDYHQVALLPHLTDEQGSFVGDRALRRLSHPLLRRTTNMRLAAAERVIACSRDLARRIRRLSNHPDVLAVRIPEPGNPDRFALHAPPLDPGEWLRVLCLGGIYPIKGSNLLVEVATILREQQIPVCITCLGTIHVELPPAAQNNPHLQLWGRYATEDLHAHVCRLRPHLAWFPFMAPETHSFALSEVLAHGTPVLATGIGAVPERLCGRSATWLLTPEEATAANIANWLDRLRRERLTTPPRWLPTDHLPPLCERFYPDEYLRPLVRVA